MKRIIFIFLLTVFAKPSKGQISRLSIGDLLPPTNLKGFYNEPTKILNTAALKNKVVIFSFWATNCSSCIANMPKLEKLQKQFGDSLAVILVTEEPYTKVNKFWKVNQITKNINLPNLMADTVLSKYFKHLGVPYEVWIDKNGVVSGLTTAEYVNESNIRALLNNIKVNWPVSQIKTKLKEGPLFTVIPSVASIKQASYYSVFSPSIAGLRLNYKYKLTTDTIKKVNFFQSINFTILDYYRYALGLDTAFGNKRNRFFLKVADSTRYFYDKNKAYKAEWMKDNAYCYESVFPMGTSESAFRYAMLTELDKVFGLKSSVAEMEVLCWVLKRKSYQGILITNKKGTVYKQIADLLHSLNYMVNNPPVIDETSLAKEVNVILSDNYTDFELLNQDLAPYGLELEKAFRRIKVLTLIE